MNEMEWQPLSSLPDNDAMKEFKFRNGETAEAPGIARGPVLVDREAGFDSGWTPLYWRYVIPTPPGEPQP